MPSRPFRWRFWLVLGLLALYLLIAIPMSLRNTYLRLRTAVRTAGLPAAAVRERAFGPAYVAAIEQIRRTIPEDEPYLLSQADKPFLASELDQPAAMLWVRFDLLPRRAMVLRSPGALEGRSPDCWRDQVRWLVVATFPGRPPALLERPAPVLPGCSPAPWRRAPR
ncbi:MAG TPA: hypothetical protein VF173_15100 [Thermoanaerobaculia bacterium]|nr:hypothetical protein [Thermoanaerobaculia bacterium]